MDSPSTHALFWLLAVAVIVHGIIAGLSFDVAAVKLPTRKRIGAMAYANFAKGNDLGNGLVVYPVLGILTIVLVAGAAAWAFIAREPGAVVTPLLAACVGTIAHTLCTARAAPIMLSLREAPDDERALSSALDRFAAWHTVRAIFQFLTFLAVLWALVDFVRLSG